MNKDIEELLRQVPQRQSGGRLEGKVSLVTGAGSKLPGWSIGRAIALSLSREGSNVIALDLDETSVSTTVQLIKRHGGRADHIVGDVTNSTSVSEILASIRSKYGRVDVLVNNVGGGGPGGALTTSDSDWEKNLQVNLTSAFNCSRATLPIMLEQEQGSIVNIGSIAGLRYPGTPTIAYSVAKAGLLHLSRMIALEFADKQVRSNTLLLGHVDTPEIRRRIAARYGGDHLDSVMDLRSKVVPQGRVASVWDIGNAAVYLASDESAHVTGTELAVDGGCSALSVPSYVAQAESQFGES